MSPIFVYMEGGGDTKATRSGLRLGMRTFLSEIAARCHASRREFNIVPCGGRKAAFDAFQNAQRSYSNRINVLLVDSEEMVRSDAIRHLAERQGDKWNLSGVQPDLINLMAQTMETWFVADWEKLAEYYGQNFQDSAKPSTSDLESAGKSSINEALERATKRTQKGAYRKLVHDVELLKRIRPHIVRERCKHCDRLFRTLSNL